ncbi:SDR family NAD(P)-dependent oxidoreductase [Telmatocola sphagniphila]|uniref:SDR family NAD(P)-dependent oxidoreductase n=1 Tax=Telmatocola sphagniphila TaxID=1123043 RepID=A0A8E6B5D7_9BACT|nr:SDR family NAD(P)-dependent oxidoreductase [Telmatocola sphagniphila]QVL31769.1 SDR family NAD(P)-dependent oxidoreductase [Telmatocola sphagniphila]
MRRELNGAAILLTGATKGIGRKVAHLLADEKAKLAITSRSQSDLDALALELRSKGIQVAPIAADLTKEEDRRKLVAEAVRQLGGLDVLINNAGLCSFGEFSTSDESILRRLMEINFFAPVEMARLCLPHLTASNNKPAILNVGSICSRRGIPSYPEHCATKHAIAGITESWRGEFQRFGVDVCLVLPGLVSGQPDRASHLLRDEGKIYLNPNAGPSEDQVARGIVKALKKGWMETVIGQLALLIHRGNRVTPWLLDAVMRKKVLSYKA